MLSNTVATIAYIGKAAANIENDMADTPEPERRPLRVALSYLYRALDCLETPLTNTTK